jgi:hypothetical protein
MTIGKEKPCADYAGLGKFHCADYAGLGKSHCAD